MDLFDLANTDYRTQIFYTSGTWRKPSGISMVFIGCYGAGGGGGGGFTRTVAQNGGGGGGGASGAIYNDILPASLVPDELYITVGVGGQGGAAQTVGTSGGITYVEAYKDGGANFVFARATGGGGGGGSVSAGVGGSAGTNAVSAVANQKLSTTGVFTSIAGQSGSAGGTTSGGIALTYGVATMINGGAGGGGCNTSNVAGAGGQITGVPPSIPTISGGAIGGNEGNVGLQRITLDVLVSMGGSGGGGNGTTASNSGNGGRGANGNIGSGGGGGGTGTSTGVGGAGGNGGDGMVIIVCY
jgi:hypothetical protein